MFRPLLAASLSCVMVLGHAPGWLHVAQCSQPTAGHGHSLNDASAEADAPPVACNGHCHHGPATNEDSGHSDQQPPCGDHDEDDCTVCHSLAVPCGVQSSVVATTAQFLIRLQALVPASELLAVEFFFDRAPRGPPA